ncbi:hypothetical protein B0T25DRAFT_473818 [Lasiosphaeria hispida]|uniref:Protein kinase domain-containing protein n=1 Tax=Lasiosphaeria hispida TaxID=260671 RepID=A0AAJ0HSA8_9PEZI|nr:hypothetical protein B0T25DRAFT_473818 [Lasiosphaeria hispida]
MSGSAQPFSYLKSDDEAWARLQSSRLPKKSRTRHVVPEGHAVSIRDMRQEKGVPHDKALDRLARILELNRVPGPQLFRLESEFCHPLGRAGGQGAVYGIDELARRKYKRAGKSVLGQWPVDVIAIKRYQRATSTNLGNGTTEEQLSNRFRDAACEVRALSPRLFRNHPNIVQLRGWGLCLDTLENPASKCCASLQVPMLVLEKADMNLAEFLQEKGAAPRRKIPDVELGVAAYCMSRAAPSSVWSSLTSAFTKDPSETIRRLCIDVGHGLGAIHHHKFSHGDLKPENILVFRPGAARGNIQWVAKICDFGHASDEDGKPDCKDRRYSGTAHWRPAQDEIKEDLLPEQKRKCDIYVYGLVVWSAFFNNGEHCSPWEPKDLEAELKCLSESDLGRRVGELIKGTMREPETRKMDPWTSLYTESERSHFRRYPPLTERVSSPENVQEHLRAVALPSSQSGVFLVPMEAKQSYSNKWWQSRLSANGGARGADADVQAADSDVPSQGVDGDPSSSSMVSLESRDADDWPLSPNLFTSEKRKDDVKEVIVEMLRLVAQQTWGRKAALELYCYARYRSRMQLEWWSRGAPVTNVLERALDLRPAVDISTLAWLTMGEIGKSEAKSLAVEWAVWSSMLESGSIDESERLVRMLLLIQAGAPVERRISGHGTILMAYIQSCRGAIVPRVITQLRRILRATNGTSSDTIAISADTRYYITGAGTLQSIIATTLSQDMALEAGLAAPGRDAPTETTGLLAAQLPAGWKAHGKLVVYEDKFTRSFTLTKPQPPGSLSQRGEIKIGDLGPNGPRSFISLTSLLRRAVRTDGGNTLQSDFAARFPIFDEAWFSFEWQSSTSSADLLGSIVDPEPWELPSFTVRIPDLGVMDAISFRIRWLASGLWQLLQGLGALVLLLATVGLALAVIGLALFLLYAYIGPFLLKVLLYILSSTLLQVLALKLIVWGPFCLNAWVMGSGYESAVVAIPFTLLWIPGGAIAVAFWIESFCADSPDGMTWDGLECKLCVINVVGCLPKRT